MVEEKTVALTIGIRYKEAQPGILVGECREFPFIIVKGKTPDELSKQVFRHIEVYFNTFPNEGKKILEKHGREIENTKQTENTIQMEEEEEGWTEQKTSVTIPIMY